MLTPLFSLTLPGEEGTYPTVSSLLVFIFSVAASLPADLEDAPPPPGASVSFADLPPSALPAPQVAGSGAETPSLVTDLFGAAPAPPSSSTWNPLVLAAIQAESRAGLSEESRAKLLASYEVKGDLAALAPPKLNQELVAALTPAVLKRDEFQASAQAQVGACLNAFGSGLSFLLRPEILQGLNDVATPALTSMAEGLHLLADHHFRLSLTRRAFTKPSLNMIGKKAADTAVIDSFLFGENFAETVKTTHACEKTGRELSRTTVAVGRKTLQPVRQPTQQRSLPPSKPSGNRRVPARQPAARRPGPAHSKGRHRSQSRTRSRYRH